MTLGTISYKKGDTKKVQPVHQITGTPPEPVKVVIQPNDNSLTQIKYTSNDYGDSATFVNGNVWSIEGSVTDVNEALNNLSITIDFIGNNNLNIDVYDDNGLIFSDSYILAGSKRFAAPKFTDFPEVIDVSGFTTGTVYNTNIKLENDPNAGILEARLKPKYQFSKNKTDFRGKRGGSSNYKAGKISVPKFEWDNSDTIIINAAKISGNRIFNLTSTIPDMWKKDTYIDIIELLEKGTNLAELNGVYKIKHLDAANNEIYLYSNLTEPAITKDIDTIRMVWYNYVAYGKTSEVANILANLELQLDSFNDGAWNYEVSINSLGGSTSKEITFTNTLTAVGFSYNINVKESLTYSLPAPDFSTPNTGTFTLELVLSDANAATITTTSVGSVTPTFSNGVWTASGDINDVESAIASETITITSGYVNDFSINATATDSANETLSSTWTFNEISQPTSVSLSNNIDVYESFNYTLSNEIDTIDVTDPDSHNVWTLSIEADPNKVVLSGSSNTTYNSANGILSSTTSFNNLNDVVNEIEQVNIDVIDGVTSDVQIQVFVNDQIFGPQGTVLTLNEQSIPMEIFPKSQTSEPQDLDQITGRNDLIVYTEDGFLTKPPILEGFIGGFSFNPNWSFLDDNLSSVNHSYQLSFEIHNIDYGLTNYSTKGTLSNNKFITNSNTSLSSATNDFQSVWDTIDFSGPLNDQTNPKGNAGDSVITVEADNNVLKGTQEYHIAYANIFYDYTVRQLVTDINVNFSAGTSTLRYSTLKQYGLTIVRTNRRQAGSFYDLVDLELTSWKIEENSNGFNLTELDKITYFDLNEYQTTHDFVENIHNTDNSYYAIVNTFVNNDPNDIKQGQVWKITLDSNGMINRQIILQENNDLFNFIATGNNRYTVWDLATYWEYDEGGNLLSTGTSSGSDQEISYRSDGVTKVFGQTCLNLFDIAGKANRSDLDLLTINGVTGIYDSSNNLKLSVNFTPTKEAFFGRLDTQVNHESPYIVNFEDNNWKMYKWFFDNSGNVINYGANNWNAGDSVPEFISWAGPNSIIERNAFIGIF